MTRVQWLIERIEALEVSGDYAEAYEYQQELDHLLMSQYEEYDY
jgi:hypothetical protein